MKHSERVTRRRTQCILSDRSPVPFPTARPFPMVKQHESSVFSRGFSESLRFIGRRFAEELLDNKSRFSSRPDEQCRPPGTLARYLAK